MCRLVYLFATDCCAVCYWKMPRHSLNLWPVRFGAFTWSPLRWVPCPSQRVVIRGTVTFALWWKTVAVAGAAHSDPCFLMSWTPNPRSLPSLHSFILLMFLSSDCTCTDTKRLFPFSFTSAAAGAVCAERLHPTGAESGGRWLETLLFAAAGSGWELAVQPAGAHRSQTVHLLTCTKTATLASYY